jgi:hypothetical protein
MQSLVLGQSKWKLQVVVAALAAHAQIVELASNVCLQKSLQLCGWREAGSQTMDAVLYVVQAMDQCAALPLTKIILKIQMSVTLLKRASYKSSVLTAAKRTKIICINVGTSIAIQDSIIWNQS